MPVPMGPSDRGPRHPANFGTPRLLSSAIQKITVGPVQTTAGTAVSSVDVYLHDIATGARVQTGTTDASGICTFYCNNSGSYYAVFHKTGSPDLVGIVWGLVAS